MPRRESCEFFGAPGEKESDVHFFAFSINKDEFVGGHEGVSETSPGLLFVDVFHFLAEAGQIGEAPIDLVGIGTAVENAQIDFFDAALILLLLL